jgi:hypothetical protein
MRREIICPRCLKEFEADEWDDGVCPTCKLDYYWDDIWTAEDYSDSTTIVCWDLFPEDKICK